MLIVRKLNYRQKKQEIQQLKNQNQQLQEQISQLQALQEENPTPTRSHTVKDLAKRQGNIRSRLNNLQATFSSFRKNTPTPKVERERERATSPILPELSTGEEISAHSFMSDSEPDTPTTLVGEEEPFLAEKELLDQIANLTQNLEQAEKFIKTLQLERDLQSHVCPSPVPHTCSPCSLPHLPTPHVCSMVHTCSHTDYDNLKTELTKKDQIIHQQAQRIRELENKPPVVETKTQEVEKIKEVERPVNIPATTSFEESLGKIIEINLQGLEKDLNILLSSQTKEQFQKVTNYWELSQLRNKEIKSYLGKGQNTEITAQPSKEITQPFKQERVFWLILLIMSLLAVGGLIVKLSSVIHKEKKKS